MYTWIDIAGSTDLEKLGSAIPSEYAPAKVAEMLAKGLSGAVRAILLEHKYVDKDYRSTFYNFYAKKGRRYHDKCFRLHFFDGAVDFDESEYRFSNFDGALEDHYFGYMVLRPTGICTVGRSIVSPDVRNGVTGHTITARHKVHLLGYELTVEGFPSMDQHNDISVCAHAACWSILRHYSQKHTMYREFLVHDITMMAQDHDPGGLRPSKGLEIAHAERVFQEAGTYPIHVARDGETASDDPSFYRQLIAYVESGFPLFAANHGDHHAFAVVGWDMRTTDTTAPTNAQTAWDHVRSLIVVDDNHLPYQAISANGAIADMLYTAEDIDAFIVPLPEKVHYPADAIDILAKNLWSLDPIVNLPDPNQVVTRYFVTTASKLRQFMREHVSEFDKDLLKVAMTLPFAQFLWVIEYATLEEWAERQITARAIIDATASHREPLPLWLAHDRRNALVFNRRNGDFELTGLQELHLKGMSNTALSRMDQNLRPIQRRR